MITIRQLMIRTLIVAIGGAFLAVAAKTQQSNIDPEDAVVKLAPTLSYPVTSTGTPDEEGFIRRWLVLEPIRVNGLTQSLVQAAVMKEYFLKQFATIPLESDKVIVDGTELRWHAVDTRLYNVNLYHFAYALGKPTSNVLFWAVTIVSCTKELKDVRLAIGSNAASVWWLNGKEVIGIYGDRQTVIDDGISKRLTLKQGPNVVHCGIVNGGGATDFCARFLDRADKPLKDFTVNLRSAVR